MFFSSIEFYVILAVIAATIVAMACRPSSQGPVLEFLLAGRLRDSADMHPAIDIACNSDGTVSLTRRAVSGLTDMGAVSIAIEKKGTDISIEERLTQGRGLPAMPVDAEFILDFMPPGRYHVRYNSSQASLFCAFTLTVRPGLQTTKPLT